MLNVYPDEVILSRIANLQFVILLQITVKVVIDIQLIFKFTDIRI
jgi:hypothetical protein